MKLAPKSFAAVAFVLALAACGNEKKEDIDPTATETPAATESAPAPSDSATPTDTPSATPSETASASPTPTPSATPSASPSAKATTAAAAGATEPASFAQCKACHSVEPGKNGIGPSLAGVFGDKAAAVPGFDFSQAMKDSGLTWNQANLDRFLADPRGVVPGTKMGFGGVKDAAKRQEIIAYLKAH